MSELPISKGELTKIGVVGAGTIGSGVALSLAQTGHNVILVDISTEILDAARRRMDRTLRLSGLSDPTLRALDVDAVIGRVRFSTRLEDLKTVDFVVENITEDLERKLTLYGKMDSICAQACVFAANTSAVQIARLAAATTRSDRVIGIHFMNPVPQKDHVELILPELASDRTLAITRKLLAQMGKMGIEVADHPGFVSNRLLMPFINDAVALVHDQVASAKDIDAIFCQCMAHNMGPLATADLIGLDTVLNTLIGLERDLSDARFAPHPLLREMVAAGIYGRKSGQGFFSYPSSDMK